MVSRSFKLRILGRAKSPLSTSWKDAAAKHPLFNPQVGNSFENLRVDKIRHAGGREIKRITVPTPAGSLGAYEDVAFLIPSMSPSNHTQGLVGAL